MRQYTIVVMHDPDDGKFNVAVPALDGCFTDGNSWDEAVAHAQDAIRLRLESLAALGEPLPDDVSTQTACVAIPGLTESASLAHGT